MILQARSKCEDRRVNLLDKITNMPNAIYGCGRAHVQLLIRHASQPSRAVRGGISKYAPKIQNLSTAMTPAVAKVPRRLPRYCNKT